MADQQLPVSEIKLVPFYQMTEEDQMKQLGLPCFFGGKSKTSRKSKKLKTTDLKETDEEYLKYLKELKENLRGLKYGERFENRVDKLFEKYPQFKEAGIILENDKELLYSITPEDSAIKIAEYCNEKIDYTILVDGFSGAGGNLIQFAVCNPNAFVIGIDNNAERLEIARKIAEIYKVSHQCEFILGDFLKSSLYFQFKPDIIFLSPPWGGRKSTECKKFKLNDLPIDGRIIFKVAKEMTDNIVYYLPKRTCDIDMKKRLKEKYSKEINTSLWFGKTACFYFGKLRRLEVDEYLLGEKENDSTLNSSSFGDEVEKQHLNKLSANPHCPTSPVQLECDSKSNPYGFTNEEVSYVHSLLKDSCNIS